MVIELKTGKFQPEYAGKLNFYIALVDDRLRREAHGETVGILICGSRNDHTVRYSLGRATSPMAVASYTYDALPADVRNDLPTADRRPPTAERRTPTADRRPAHRGTGLDRANRKLKTAIPCK